MDSGSGQVGSTGSGSGMAPNVAGALSYVLGFITGIVFIMIDKNQFVRFHAFQSIFLSIAWIGISIALGIISLIFAFIPVIGTVISLLLGIVSMILPFAFFILWLVLIYKAYKGERFSLPYIGPMAEKYAAQQS